MLCLDIKAYVMLQSIGASACLYNCTHDRAAIKNAMPRKDPMTNPLFPTDPPQAQPVAPKKRKPRRILTPDDWVDAATNLLVSKSIDAVRIDLLAKSLEITIGSFYYHFKDREDLLLHVLKKWHETTMTQVLQSSADLPFDQGVQQILSIPFHGETARRAAMVEFAIRGWARRDDLARKVVSEVDRERLATFTVAMQKAGYSKAEAGNRAFLAYSFQLSQALLWEAQDDKARKSQMAYVKKIVLSH